MILDTDQNLGSSNFNPERFKNRLAAEEGVIKYDIPYSEVSDDKNKNK